MRIRHHSSRLDQLYDGVALLPTGDIDAFDDFFGFWIDLNGGDFITAIVDLHFPYDLIFSLLQGGLEHIASLDCRGLGNCLLPGHGLLDVAADLCEQDDAVF